MATTQVSDRTVRLRGRLRLYLAPQHLNSLTERGMEADCLLFQMFNDEVKYPEHIGRPVEYTLRLKAARPVEEEQAETSASKERMLLDSLTPNEAALFDSSCLVQAVLCNAQITDLTSPDDNTVMMDLTSPDDDAVEIAEFPTRHIFLRDGEIGKPLVQRAVKRHVVTLGLLSLEEAVCHLPAFLANLAPSTSLRRLFLMPMSARRSISRDALDHLTAALTSSSLEGVSFMGQFSNLFGDVAAHDFLNSMTYLGIESPGYTFWKELATKEAGESTELKVRQLSVSRSNFWEITSALKLANAALLTRLDTRTRVHVYPGLAVGERSIANLQSLTDVGLSIRDSQSLTDLLDAKLHTKILVLRLEFFEQPLMDRAWKLLIMDDDSTVQFFDCCLSSQSRYGVLHSLAGDRAPAALTALKVRHFYPQREPDFSTSLAKYLCSPAACNLVYLDAGDFYMEDVDRQFRGAMTDWEVANSLVNNFSLCTFVFPFGDTAAESYAIKLLCRNRLYRDSQLLTEPQVKPNVAKLFLCGHGRVGKTTLRLALQSMQISWSKTLSVLNGLCCLNSRPDGPDPTRGMETHFLSLQRSPKKLLICDLAGQEEFHVFHHYFMNASINDIFVVVCKYDTRISLKDFQLQLEYWLRFIVSDRSSRHKSFMASDAADTHIKPKVIVVVNFFQQQQNGAAITQAWTLPSIQKFFETLDFAAEDGSQQHTECKNLFWLNARSGFRVQMLGERLKLFLSEFHNAAIPIPKLCYDISTHLTQAHRKNGLFANILCTGKAKSRLLLSYSEILEAMSKPAAVHQSSRVQAALQELHTQGYVIYFPSEEIGGAHGSSNSMHGEVVREDRIDDTLVITDTNWFSNKLIGSLLGTHLPDAPIRPCQWKWEIEEIKHMLRIHGCAEHHHEEILRYLEHLELCVSLDSAPGAEKGLLLFPALAKNNKILFPEESNTSSTAFFGRRIKCKDPSVQLIPFGVFTRVQVKLHKAYAPHNDSFVIGYGWLSFIKGRVGVVVRLGGDVINDTWESKEWIDILIFCLDNRGSNACNMKNSGEYHTGCMDDLKLIAAEALVTEIRSQLYLTCKEGGLGGIPTVTMEEMVLRNKTESSPSVCLSEVLDKARRAPSLQDCCHEWRGPASTLVLNLLLPKEIEGLVRSRLNVLVNIGEEFCDGSEEGDGSEGVQLEQDAERLGSGDALPESQPSADGEGVQLEQDTERLGSGDALTEIQLYRYLQMAVKDLKSYIKSCSEDTKSEIRMQRTMLEKYIDRGLQMVRQDIRNLEVVQRQSVQEIISNCSTRLLRHELRKDRAYPLYPYLVDVEAGKLASLWEAMFGRKVVRVHFLCEAPEEEGGRHPVEWQKGREVSINWKPWVRKAARVMVPAVKIICCLARLAASAYLPSAQVFIPSPEFLVGGLGLEGSALQHVILPKALDALLSNLPDVEVKEVMRGRLQEQEVQEVVAAILQNEQVDMADVFGLKRVIFDDKPHHRTLWVCERHSRHKAAAIPIKNPYSA